MFTRLLLVVLVWGTSSSLHQRTGTESASPVHNLMYKHHHLC
jgi:hypothetical protein